MDFFSVEIFTGPGLNTGFLFFFLFIQLCVCDFNFFNGNNQVMRLLDKAFPELNVRALNI